MEPLEAIEMEDLDQNSCKGGELLRMPAECWLEWQRYRRHDDQVKALGATLTRSTSGTSLILEGHLLPAKVAPFSLLDGDDYRCFCSTLDAMDECQAHQQTVPETVNKFLASLAVWLELVEVLTQPVGQRPQATT